MGIGREPDAAPEEAASKALMEVSFDTFMSAAFKYLVARGYEIVGPGFTKVEFLLNPPRFLREDRPWPISFSAALAIEVDAWFRARCLLSMSRGRGEGDL